jgi:FeS assembly SUF system protein
MSNETVRRFEVEIVDEVPPVPKQPPLAGDTPAALVGRKRDYLDGFLKEQAPAADALEGETLTDAVVAALRDIFDPEIPVNIYDLGLIYGVEADDGHVTINMTLTTPHCPVAETMPGEVELRVMAVPGVATCDVNLVWDPPWNPASMSDEARLELGML